MLLGRTDFAAPGETGQQCGMRTSIERRQFHPCVEMGDSLVAIRRQAGDKLFQHGGVACVKTAALGGKPAVEKRAAFELQPVEQIAGEMSGQRPAAAPASSVSIPRAATRLISSASTKQPSRSSATVSPCSCDPTPVRCVERGAQLAQAPAQLAAGIVGHIPQQFAQPAAPHGVRRQRQIGKQRTQLARGRQRHRHAVAHDFQRSEQAHGQALPVAVQP